MAMPIWDGDGTIDGMEDIRRVVVMNDGSTFYRMQSGLCLIPLRMAATNRSTSTPGFAKLQFFESRQSGSALKMLESQESAGCRPTDPIAHGVNESQHIDARIRQVAIFRIAPECICTENA